MKLIEINSQAELDKIKRVEKDEELVIKVALRLNFELEVFGKLRLRASLDCNRWEGRRIVARGNSSVEAWGNSSVVARGNSSVVAWENSSVEARENSSVEAWGNSSVVAWGNSSVVARGNSSVEAWGNSSVEAWENSSVVARGNSVVRLFHAIKKVALHGFSICFKPISLKFKLEINSKHVHVQEYQDLGWFERNGVEEKTKVILFKKVSHDFKTQENTENETLWKVGSTVEHKAWDPEKEECGPGKFHACSRPYFCDEFRNEKGDLKGDLYIAIEIKKADLFEWKKNPGYPHKIGFRKGKVLFQCDKYGKEVAAKAVKS